MSIYEMAERASRGPTSQVGKEEGKPASIPSEIKELDQDPEVQAIDVRLYFDRSEDPEDLLNRISDALQESPRLAFMISAYHLVVDGSGKSIPDSRPLA